MEPSIYTPHGERVALVTANMDADRVVVRREHDGLVHEFPATDLRCPRGGLAFIRKAMARVNWLAS